MKPRQVYVLNSDETLARKYITERARLRSLLKLSASQRQEELSEINARVDHLANTLAQVAASWILDSKEVLAALAQEELDITKSEEGDDSEAVPF